MLVARRKERLRALADELGGATVVAEDLVEPGAAERIRDAIEREHGELHLLVNNAGSAWRGTFSDTGWANVERHMRLNFEAVVRLTEALLPVLRRTAASGADGRRVSLVNVASTAGRVSRPVSGAYSASKFALAGWTDALHGEEKPHGVHVGLVSKPEVVADAIFEAGPGGKPERYVPRPYWLAAAARILAPALVRRAAAGGAFTTKTGASD